jgi:glycosyltransferase involved in cell wall biosynthesis
MMAMKRVPVINRVPDLGAVGMVENEHFYGFSTLDEAIAKTEIALSNPKEAQEIAENAYNLVVNNHTWDKRVQSILQECGLA